MAGWALVKIKQIGGEKGFQRINWLSVKVTIRFCQEKRGKIFTPKLYEDATVHGYL
jgi:hypothetical protein